MYYHAVEDYLNKFQTLISEASYTNLCTIVLGTSNSVPEPDCDSAGWEASLCNMSGKAFTFYLAENGQYIVLSHDSHSHFHEMRG